MIKNQIKTCLYQYQALDSNGKKCKSFRAADNRPAVLIALIDEGFLQIKCSRVYLSPWSRQRIKPNDIGYFFGELSTTLNAGVSLVDALKLLQASRKVLLQSRIEAIHNSIQQGQAFSKALTKHCDLFADIEIQLIEFAESTGTLSQTLENIAQQYQARLALKEKIQKALTYPIAVMIIGVVITGIMLTCVLPKFATLYQNLNAQLPLLTQVLIGISHSLRHNGLTLIITLLALIFVLKYQRIMQLRPLWYQLRWRLPVFGKLIQLNQHHRWIHTLSLLLNNGIPLLNALKSTQNLIQHQTYQAALNKITQQVMHGMALSQAIEQQHCFPNDLIQMIRISEQTGTLAQMLQNYSHIQAQKINTLTGQLANLLEPLVMTFIGGMIGLLVMAMYLPIIQMGNAL